MRTTLNIADHVLIEAKQVAARRRLTLAGLVEDSLRRYLSAEGQGNPVKKRFRLRMMDGGGPLPDIDLTDTSDLMDR